MSATQEVKVEDLKHGDFIVNYGKVESITVSQDTIPRQYLIKLTDGSKFPKASGPTSVTVTIKARSPRRWSGLQATPCNQLSVGDIIVNHGEIMEITPTGTHLSFEFSGRGATGFRRDEELLARLEMRQELGDQDI